MIASFFTHTMFDCLLVVLSLVLFSKKRGLLRWAALFLGELRDGLTMINMQSAFLIVSKNYTEKQAGILFFGKCHSIQTYRCSRIYL
jgi:hypothetical protein